MVLGVLDICCIQLIRCFFSYPAQCFVVQMLKYCRTGWLLPRFVPCLNWETIFVFLPSAHSLYGLEHILEREMFEDCWEGVTHLKNDYKFISKESISRGEIEIER